MYNFVALLIVFLGIVALPSWSVDVEVGIDGSTASSIGAVVPKRRLGTQGLVVPPIGLGCMGMTAFYDAAPQSEDKSLEAIFKALEKGYNFFDTAWIYQSFGKGGVSNQYNEDLLGKAIKIHGRDKFIIATKFGIKMGESGMVYSGKAETIRSQLADSLQRLGTDYVDLYYMHRMDPSTPIEETMTALKELVNEGKIKYIGLSECTPDELRRANAVHPVSAVQMEYSLQTRDIENTVLPVARELGVGIVPYSPLGRGLLSATFKTRDDIPEGDWRKTLPRFKDDEVFSTNNAHQNFFDFAAKKGCTPAQLALAWLLAQGEDIVPIPGTKSAARVVENIDAAAVQLTPEEVKQVGEMVPPGVGDRYDGMSGTFNTRL